LDTRYQAFVSSTYEDLKDERREVTQALLELDCLPAGMEMFVASTDDQWTIIEQVIGESDYYVLIIGGRYGSVTEEGISYTEKEFDLALKLKIPVLVFVPQSPDDIPQGKTDKDDRLREKLETFKQRAMTGRTVAFYTDAHDLGSQVSRALVRAIRTRPGVGWVRGDQAMTVDQQREVVELRERINQLETEKLAATSALVEDLAGIAQGSETVTIPLLISDKYDRNIERAFLPFTSTWDDIFAEVGPLMLDEAREDDLEERLENHLLYTTRRSDKLAKALDAFGTPESEIYYDDWDMVCVQLRALGLVENGTKKRPIHDSGKYLVLTAKGRRHLVTLRAVKKGVDPGEHFLKELEEEETEDTATTGDDSGK
jgi:Domain of unknown function (DUF4062)